MNTPTNPQIEAAVKIVRDRLEADYANNKSPRFTIIAKYDDDSNKNRKVCDKQLDLDYFDKAIESAKSIQPDFISIEIYSNSKTLADTENIRLIDPDDKLRDRLGGMINDRMDEKMNEITNRLNETQESSNGLGFVEKINYEKSLMQKDNELLVAEMRQTFEKEQNARRLKELEERIAELTTQNEELHNQRDELEESLDKEKSKKLAFTGKALSMGLNHFVSSNPKISGLLGGLLGGGSEETSEHSPDKGADINYEEDEYSEYLEAIRNFIKGMDKETFEIFWQIMIKFSEGKEHILNAAKLLNVTSNNS